MMCVDTRHRECRSVNGVFRFGRPKKYWRLHRPPATVRVPERKSQMSSLRMAEDCARFQLYSKQQLAVRHIFTAESIVNRLGTLDQMAPFESTCSGRPPSPSA
jgi:hypothetical protein